MASSAQNKLCYFCAESVAEGGGKAIFTAECSHSFHFVCIQHYISTSKRLCPVCATQWTNLPFLPPQNTSIFPPQFLPPQNTSIFPPSLLQYSRFQNIFHQPPIYHQQPQSPFPNFFTPDPISFHDDEPLPVDDPMSIDAHVDSQKVSIKAVPELGAVAASESVPEFAILVSLKAPSLSSRQQRAPIDIVTVLDVSGSMTGMKLSLLKRAVHFVIDNLGVSDRLSIVSFSDRASRMLSLRRMTEAGRADAKMAADSLVARGGTNIADGLRVGAGVLEQRRYKNPVASIVFLSDGNDTYNIGTSLRDGYGGNMYGLPPSIFPGSEARPGEGTIPVHSFGFGSDHDPVTMHAIADASGGTFSFIESYEMVQDAFAGCIGGLLSVVTQELRLKLRSASHGVEIKSIPSGRYRREISNQGSEGLIHVGDLYADEEKEFLINVSVPACTSTDTAKTSLLDITCSYKDTITKQSMVIEGDLIETRRPTAPSPEDSAVNLEVDRQKSRISAAEGMRQAQQMAEKGNLFGATSLLQQKRSELMSTAAAQAGDGMAQWLEGEMKETERRFGSTSMYQQSGRAFALAGMSSHASQRATTRGGLLAGGAAPAFGGPMGGLAGIPTVWDPSGAAPSFGGYATPQMAKMVCKSQQQQQQQQSKAGEGSTSK